MSVKYSEHQVPCHDIAGWHKERVKQKPGDVVNIAPDWVCEIITPNHISKDTYKVIASIQNQSKMRLEPFTEIEFVFG